MLGIDDILMGGATILGGLLGGKKGATNQVQSNAKSMDPRVDAMYFGQGGLLSDLNDWYAKNKTGLNPDMQAGLDHMRSVYQSPLATQGYERMGNVGYNLMGQGVAGNPFLTGNMPNFGNLQSRQQGPQFQDYAGGPATNPNWSPQAALAGDQPQRMGAQGQPTGNSVFDKSLPTDGLSPEEMAQRARLEAYYKGDVGMGANMPQQPAQQPMTQPQANLGLSQPLSLSDNWAKPVAPVAPAAPSAPMMDADQFRKLFEEEMKRQNQVWGPDPANNPLAGFGA